MHEGNFIKCDQCNKQFSIFSGKHTLAIHKSNVHGNFRLRCSLCDYTCRQRRSLNDHISAVHENNPKLMCNVCENLFLSERSLKNHILYLHSGKLFSCKECPRNLSCFRRLRMHMKSFHGNQIIKCSMCDFRSKSERQAEEHNQTKHNGVKYTCNQCDYESEILKELKGHQNENGHNATYANTGLLCKAILKFMCKQCTKAKHTTVTSAISAPARQEQLDGTRKLNIRKA